MDGYRKLMLFSKGLLYDTTNSYASAAKSFANDALDVDVTGHVFMITGANSGIGFATAKEVAARGGEVHMVCRNEERGTKARNAIAAETGNEKVHLHVLDMSRAREVADFARRFADTHQQLDVLVNNAGEMILELERTQDGDGREATFATNSLGPYLLTQGLLPLIKRSTRKPRVVTVTSAGMMLQKVDHQYFDDIDKESYDGIMAYGQCKRQMTVLTEHWAANYPEIHFSCMHPGWVDTPAARRGLAEFYDKMKHKFRSPEEGADTVLWLCIAEKPLAVRSGEYFQDRAVVSKHLPLGCTTESKSQRRSFIDFMQKQANDVTQRSPAA